MKGKSIYFTAKEIEALIDFYNHWDDKLTREEKEDEEFYAYWTLRTGTAFNKIFQSKKRKESD